MKDAIVALNQIQQDGVIEKYAIGGAIGATFYIEALNTEDVDVFVFLLPVPGSFLISLTPIYDALRALGGQIRGEHIVIGQWPIQILAAEPGLVSDALERSIEVPYENEQTHVFTAEHLCAIALKTGRSKDYLRVTNFIDQEAVDVPLLNAMVEHYSLEDKLTQVSNWPTQIHPIAAQEWVEWFGSKPLSTSLELLGNERRQVLYVAGDGIILDCDAAYVVCPQPEEVSVAVGEFLRLSNEGQLER
ncbi:MAG TPA: hypothetical protein VH105_23645 [Burkholderiales bacterium]|nr:hypothetical protein [Burkholderiales bacterium]